MMRSQTTTEEEVDADLEELKRLQAEVEAAEKDVARREQEQQAANARKKAETPKKPSSKKRSRQEEKKEQSSSKQQKTTSDKKPDTTHQKIIQDLKKQTDVAKQSQAELSDLKTKYKQ